MDKWTEVILGLVIVIGAVLFAWASSEYNWILFGKDINLLHAAWLFLKGGVWWITLMIGILFIILGINDLRG